MNFLPFVQESWHLIGLNRNPFCFEIDSKILELPSDKEKTKSLKNFESLYKMAFCLNIWNLDSRAHVRSLEQTTTNAHDQNEQTLHNL